MSLTPQKQESTNRTIAPAGTHRAVLYKIINLGTIPTEWMGQEKKSHKIRLIWELTDEKIEYEKDGEKKSGPIVVGRKFTFSLGDKSSLYPIVVGMIGGLTDDERWNFNIESLLGTPCLVTVVHDEFNGKPYAKITSASMLPRGMEIPTQVNKSVVIDVRNMSQEEIDKLPEYLAKDMQASDEYHVRFLAPRGNNNANDVYAKHGVESINPEDVPFN